MIESKKNILELLPEKIVPKTLFFESPVSKEEVMGRMQDSAIHFPVILKPDYGERGWQVEKIEDSNELERYLKMNRMNILVQEFIDYPVELGIFYIRHPGNEMGSITSIVRKQLLYVTGDGSASVKELINRNPRAFLQYKNIEKRHPDLLFHVPGKGEKIELVPIANHSRGATFLNGNSLINDQLSKVIHNFAKDIPGFFYGRFDIRCQSIQDLNLGKNFKILELNGAKSEPAHIYHPGYSLREAYGVIFNHWYEMYTIAMLNKSSGIDFPSFSAGWTSWKKYRYYARLRNT